MTSILAAFALSALSAAQSAQLDSGDVVLQATRDDTTGIASVDAWIDVPAPPSAVWAAMTDCAAAPSLVPNLKSCAIIDRDPKGAWEIREHVVDPGWLLPDVRSRFRADLTPPRQMRFAEVEGDFDIMRGTWTLLPHGEGATRLHYEAQLKPHMWVPGFVIRHAIDIDAPNSLRALRDEAVRRARPN